METVMDRFDPARRFDAPRVIAARAVAATILDFDRPRILADFDADGAVMVGVARLSRDTIHGLWERHDGGDEILVVIRGRLTATFREAREDRQLAAGAGDVILIPRGVPHSFAITSDEVELLFLTPRSGNTGWSDDGKTVSRHP
jgi:mannose-6-phosphate isomerase-like protein (cupin superfamily)